MKKLIEKTGQVLTGAATTATLFAGRAMATMNYDNPAQAGADAARGNGEAPGGYSRNTERNLLRSSSRRQSFRR